MSEPSDDQLVDRVEQIIEWSRSLTPRERETLRECVSELRRSQVVPAELFATEVFATT